MYLYYDRTRKLTMTDKIGRATKFATEAKAYNVLTCSFPKKKREGWVVLPYVNEPPEPKRFRADNNVEMEDMEPFDWDSVKACVKDSFSNLLSYKEKLSKRLFDIEAELCDCEHACEFFKLDAAKGYRLYAMIRERRVKRRYIKDELWKVNSVLGMSYTDIAGGMLEKSFEEINSQSYEPRVLKELFEV